MIDKGQWWEFGQDTGVTPPLFTRSAMGFLMATESGPRFNVSSERRILLYYCFYCNFDQINAAVVSRRNIFQKHELIVV